MKNLIIAILTFSALAIAGIPSASQYHYSTHKDRAALQPKDENFHILLVDVTLNPSDTGWSKPIDLYHVPINYRDTGTGDAALLPDYTLGNGMLSCYDVSDSSGVTDSVDVTAQIYKSQYAGDGIDPLSPKSDAWATLGSAYSVDDASAASAIVEATAAITLASHLDRYIRVRLINDHAVAKDVSRCRFYVAAKKVRR
jgi:hypothetical protein